MEFAEGYEAFIRHHEEKRTGERLRRLREGHGHAEKLFLQQIWWPAVGHFRYLHPEYEVRDFHDGTRFVDFAYVRPPFRICFELDGYGPHLRDVDRWRFGDNLMRQNQLVLDDWKVFRFSCDDITQKQRRCQQFILHIMGRWFGEQIFPVRLSSREKEIARMALDAVEPLKPKLVAARLGIRVENSRKWLHRLHEKGILRPAGGEQRIRSYDLGPAGEQLYL